MRVRCWRVAILLLLCVLGKTAYDIHLPVAAFREVQQHAQQQTLLDRQGVPIATRYMDVWNASNIVPLHEVPLFLQKAFVVAEDRRFFEHHGVDWLARGSALWQRVVHGKKTRGASTITEQVVRMLHSRPRNYWSKWLEGLEAIALEMSVNKGDILEFYVNQVPYGAHRRGVAQAAHFYFNRDVETLNQKEMLALVVLVRAPSAFDLRAAKVDIEKSMLRLAGDMGLSAAEMADIKTMPLVLEASGLTVSAPHFARYVRDVVAMGSVGAQAGSVVTTLQSSLQGFVENLLLTRLKELSKKHVKHAAAMVVDHTTREVLAWVSVGADCADTAHQAQGCKIDMVSVPRQPGSALKPFLYAAALEKGWEAATIIEDAPYADSVGTGIHHFRNYSRTYYGNVTLRAALGNSLNIPALKAIHYVSPEVYLSFLLKLGFSNLTQHFDFYDEGLALGNGEVTLFALAQAYAALAQQGQWQPLKVLLHDAGRTEKRALISPEVASLIGNILSDPWARGLEFGRSSVLNLPVQTAVKTGTSTDYRDAWAVGYDARYVVAVWMGNADYTPTDGVTGSTGPALALRGVFNHLVQYEDTKPLYLSPKLLVKQVCLRAEDALRGAEDCPMRTEYFIPRDMARAVTVSGEQPVSLYRPAQGLQMAFDPRIPAEKQMFEMQLLGVQEDDDVVWMVDGVEAARRKGALFLWAVQRGKHRVSAKVWRDGVLFATTKTHEFVVK